MARCELNQKVWAVVEVDKIIVNRVTYAAARKAIQSKAVNPFEACIVTSAVADRMATEKITAKKPKVTKRKRKENLFAFKDSQGKWKSK